MVWGVAAMVVIILVVLVVMMTVVHRRTTAASISAFDISGCGRPCPTLVSRALRAVNPGRAGSSLPGCFKPGCLHFLRRNALWRSFVPFGALLRSLRLPSFALICDLLRAFAGFCKRPRLARPRLGTAERVRQESGKSPRKRDPQSPERVLPGVSQESEKSLKPDSYVAHPRDSSRSKVGPKAGFWGGGVPESRSEVHEFLYF